MSAHRFWLIALFTVLFTGRLAGAEDYCEICKTRFVGDGYLVKDNYHNKTRIACKPCTLLTTRCVVCEMQTRPELGLQLPDGRVYCAEDAKTAVMTEATATPLFEKAKDQALEFLKPYPPVALRNIQTHLVTREEFNRQYRRTPGVDNPDRLLGLTITRQAEEGKLEHDIYVLHGVPEDEFLSVCAHEYTHTWLNEHEKKTRQIHKDTQEGFCELVAYKVVNKMGFEQEKKRITASTYTRGQINALLTAENEYNFYRLVRWISDGVDSWVEVDKLPRILVLRDNFEETPQPQPLFQFGPAKPTPVPNELVLKGLSGPPTHRFALINNTTMGIGEETRVRVGTSNVLVRCLSIEPDAVNIQVRGEKAPRKLQLDVR